MRDAGRYDGILGVLMAIEVVRALRPAAGTLRFGLDVVAFWDEEGARFGTALLGSVRDGRPLERGVVGPDRRARHHAAHGVQRVRPGPGAHRHGRAVAGVVGRATSRRTSSRARSSTTAARRWASSPRSRARDGSRCRSTARPGTPGGARYEKRHDALLGASEVALAVERLCRAEHHIIGTVGRLETFPGAVNVVPGEARLTVDLRGEHDDDRDRVWGSITRELDEIAGRRGLTWSARELHEAPAVMCDALLQDVVRAGIEDTGRRHVPALFSRAGHDAMAIGAVTGVGMLFLRNPDGISHHPDEDVSLADVETGLRGADRDGRAPGPRGRLRGSGPWNLSVFDPVPDIRLIAVDMDGSLLDDEKQIHDDFWPLLDELARRGILLCPASGRQYATLRRQFGRDELVYIAENGAYVVQHDEEISADGLALGDGARGGRDGPRRPTHLDLGTVLCGKRSAYVERTDDAFLDQATPVLREARARSTTCSRSTTRSSRSPSTTSARRPTGAGPLLQPFDARWCRASTGST